jgi:hypothetical protein
MEVTTLDVLISKLGSNAPEYFLHEYGGGLELQQVPKELSDLSRYLLERLAGRNVNYLEVGIGSCATLIFLSEFLNRHNINVTLSAVDNFDYYKKGQLEQQKARVEWCVENLGLTFFNCDSSTSAIDSFLINQVFDVILVDGDHSYEGCLLDLATCLPFLKEGGILILHDVTSLACPGVGRVYEFAKKYFKSFTTISHSATCGIGILEGPRVYSLGEMSVLRELKAEISSLRDQVRAIGSAKDASTPQSVFRSRLSLLRRILQGKSEG